MVTEVQYTDQAQTQYRAVIDDVVWFGAFASDTEITRQVQTWMDAGNVPGPPPPDTVRYVQAGHARAQRKFEQDLEDDPLTALTNQALEEMP